MENTKNNGRSSQGQLFDFSTISTLEELLQLDSQEMMRGYFHGLHGGSAPASDKCRGFHHGWLNGRVDGGYALPTTEQLNLSANLSNGKTRVLH